MPNEDALTASQWYWLSCQMLLDDGFSVCSECDALGQGTFCTVCGTRLQPAPRLCEQCHLPGEGAHCGHCGAVLRSAVEEALAAGTLDWDAWADSLQPFLGGLTPQEQALIAQG